jgi:hypothetical protein
MEESSWIGARVRSILPNQLRPHVAVPINLIFNILSFSASMDAVPPAHRPQ